MLVFDNCPFTILLQAFHERWPDTPVKIQWTSADELPEGTKGTCGWSDGDPTAYVEIAIELPVIGAVDILAHELAHAAVSRGEAQHGPDYHSEEWATACAWLYERYVSLTMQAGEVTEISLP